jgi:hypothetical protein
MVDRNTTRIIWKNERRKISELIPSEYNPRQITETNFTWMVYDWRIGAREQSILFAAYFLLAIWGIAKWRRADV